MTGAVLVLVAASLACTVSAYRSVRAGALVRRRLGWVRARSTVRWPLVLTAASAAASRAAAVDALPDVVDAAARAIRAGSSPSRAVAEAAVSAPPALAASLREASASAERGVPLAVAMDGWSQRCGIDGAPLVAAALAVTSGAGGDAARSLASVADTLRERRALRREVRALSSQARLSAGFIAAAPAGFAVLAAATDRATVDFLFRTPLGLACLVGGLGLDAAGWRWMVRITESVR